MASFFNSRDKWGIRYSTWVLAILFFTLLPLIGRSVARITMENNVENWLAEDDPQVRLLSWYRKNFPTEERVVVSWDGSSLDDPRLEAFSTKLEGVRDSEGIRRGGNRFIEDVTTPGEILNKFIDNHVEPDEAIRRLSGVLVGKGALKIKLSELGLDSKSKTKKILEEKAKKELGLAIRIMPAYKSWSPAEGFEFPKVKKSDDDEEEKAAFEAPEIAEHDFQVSWKEFQPDSELTKAFIQLAKNIRQDEKASADDRLIDDAFIAIGSPIVMVVELNDAGTLNRKEAFESIRLAAEELGIPREELHMGGRMVGAETLNQEVMKSAWNKEAPLWNLPKRSVMLLSGLVGAILSFFVMRSIRLASLVLIASYYATLATVALVPATGGTMNMVLIVMPTLLLVLTLSGGIHVANYWRHAMQDNPKTAVATAYQMAAQPCILASITTAIGLGSLATSSLFPVRDFGIYSAAGCLISLFLVLIGIPSLLQLFGGKAEIQATSSGKTWMKIGNLISRNYVVITIMCLALFVAGTSGLMKFQTETKVIRYFPEKSKIVRDYRTLEENVIGIIPLDTIVRFDTKAQEDTPFFERMEIVREIEQKIREYSEISGTVSLADFLEVMEKLPSEKPDDMSNWKWTSMNAIYNRKGNDIREKVLDGTFNGAGLFLKEADEDADWISDGDKALSKQGDELWRITAQGYVMVDNDYDKLLKDLDGIVSSVTKNYAGSNHVVTGMVPVFLRTQQAVLESLIYSFVLAFGVIALIMMFLLKNPIAGLLTMLPNLLPVGVVFGVISWMGMRVDVGTMITASVALGIAVDGTLHLLTWFRKGLVDGMTPREAIQQGLSHCGPAMCQTSGIVAIGLLMLAPSDLILISRFGCLMATLVGTALIADLLFLPALLAGPLGRLIQSTAQEQKKLETVEAENEVLVGSP